MAGVEGHRVSEWFLHVLNVRIVCPFCGRKWSRLFFKNKPRGRFHPSYENCTCGKYTYSPSADAAR